MACRSNSSTFSFALFEDGEIDALDSFYYNFHLERSIVHCKFLFGGKYLGLKHLLYVSKGLQHKEELYGDEEFSQFVGVELDVGFEVWLGE